jgi:spore coat protein A
LDRRRFLRVGALGAGAVAAQRTGLVGRFTEHGPAPGRDLRTLASPAVTPFTSGLRVPSDAVATSTLAGDLYEIELRPETASILPGMSTPIWGYDGLFPGPTIRARSGRPVSVRFHNSLPADVAIHLHGGHVAPDMDGHPMDLIAPGDTKRYDYPNAQAHSTLWYHDHAMDHTAENIYRGLAGLYLLSDDIDTGLGLPAGDHDIPLLLQDRTFNADGSFFYPDTMDPRRHDGVQGDVFLVNGVPVPFLEVDRTWWRFRIINGSNSRVYELALAGRPLTQIASDGGLLAAPVNLPSITLGIAERAEILVDFSTADPGEHLELRDVITDKPVMRFDVSGSGAGGGVLPQSLRTIPPPEPAVRTREVRFSFDDSRQQWVLNGRPFDMDRIEFRPRLGTTEEWHLVNESSFIHPFHMHLVMFRVLKRGLVNAPANERGLKDTVRVNPKETVTIAAPFSGFTGTYVFHCHVLEHEDHSMMSQFRVVDLPRLAGPDRTATAAAVCRAEFATATTVMIATGSSYTDALAGGPAAAAHGAPLLLTVGTSLPQPTRDELARLRPGNIIVLGGPGAVPPGVEAELRSYAPVTRIAGVDRYATAAAVATATFTADVPVAYIATGSGFAAAGPPYLGHRHPPGRAHALRHRRRRHHRRVPGPGAHRLRGDGDGLPRRPGRRPSRRRDRCTGAAHGAHIPPRCRGPGDRPARAGADRRARRPVSRVRRRRGRPRCPALISAPQPDPQGSVQAPAALTLPVVGS